LTAALGFGPGVGSTCWSGAHKGLTEVCGGTRNWRLVLGTVCLAKSPRIKTQFSAALPTLQSSPMSSHQHADSSHPHQPPPLNTTLLPPFSDLSPTRTQIDAPPTEILAHSRTPTAYARAGHVLSYFADHPPDTTTVAFPIFVRGSCWGMSRFITKKIANRWIILLSPKSPVPSSLPGWDRVGTFCC
jgi:hypothetical protein